MAIVKEKQFYDTLESTASTKFTETGLTRRQESLISQKQKLASLSPESTTKNKQEIQIDEEFTQNFKEHYDIAEEALMTGKKVSRDCKVEENDLEYEMNVLRIKIQQELNEIEFSLQPTLDKTWKRLRIQQNSFEAENADSKKSCRMLGLDFEEVGAGVQQLVERMKELERKTGNWIMFKKKAEQDKTKEQQQQPKNLSSNQKNLN